MGKVKDLTGHKFGRLTVIKQNGFGEKNKSGNKMPLPEPYQEGEQE